MNPKICLAMLVAFCLSNASSSASIEKSLENENNTLGHLAGSAISNVTVILNPAQDTNSSVLNNSASNEPASQQTGSVPPTLQSVATGSAQTNGRTTVLKITQSATVRKENHSPTKPTVKQVPTTTETTTKRTETKPPTKATDNTQTTTKEKETESPTRLTVKQSPPTTQTTSGTKATTPSTTSKVEQDLPTTQTTTEKEESTTSTKTTSTSTSPGPDTEPIDLLGAGENEGTGDGNDNEPSLVEGEENGKPAWEQNSNVYRRPDPYEHTTSHFAAFFLTSIVLIFAAYVLYHNRQKIIAIIIEGRNDGNSRRRGYRKVETNVEEAMPSLRSSNSTYVY
ncbi:hypothetical protein ACROYT_G006592 [Oculina patagonica]